MPRLLSTARCGNGGSLRTNTELSPLVRIKHRPLAGQATPGVVPVSGPSEQYLERPSKSDVLD